MRLSNFALSVFTICFMAVPVSAGDSDKSLFFEDSISIDSLSLNDTTGGIKLCSYHYRGLWRDTLVVPDNWTAKNCALFAEYATVKNPSYELICLTNGSYILGTSKLDWPAPCGNVSSTHSETGEPLSVAKGNTALGIDTLPRDTAGSKNVAVGSGALSSNNGALMVPKAGSSNTAVGWQALNKNGDGKQNTAIGESALASNITGSHNTAIGEDSLFSTGKNYFYFGAANGNTAVGESALYDNLFGNNNVALGRYSLNRLGRMDKDKEGEDAEGGSRNTGVGPQSGCLLEDGSNNIYLGNVGAKIEDNTIRIGNTKNVSLKKCPEEVNIVAHKSTYIAGVHNTPIEGGRMVAVDKNGKLGTVASSRRFKDNIKPIVNAEETLLSLRPVQFNYKGSETDQGKSTQFGLIAEDVSQKAPNLVHFDDNGIPYSVKYEALVPLLLSVLQRDHDRLRLSENVIQKLLDDNRSLRNELQDLRDQLHRSLD